MSHDAFDRFMEFLGKEEQAVVGAVIIRNKSQGEAAQELGISEIEVKEMISEVRRKLGSFWNR